MSYIFIAIGCFIIWWIINGIIVLKIRRPHILNIVNKENWLKEKTREMYKKIGEIEKTEEITWRKLSKNEETYNEMLYNQRYNWAAEVLKTYGVTIRDVPKMI